MAADFENALQQAVFDENFLFGPRFAAVAAGKVAAGFNGSVAGERLIKHAHLVFYVQAVAPAAAGAAGVAEKPSAVDFFERFGAGELLEFESEGNGAQVAFYYGESSVFVYFFIARFHRYAIFAGFELFFFSAQYFLNEYAGLVKFELSYFFWRGVFFLYFDAYFASSVKRHDDFEVSLLIGPV
ncbi:MAG: hypothetical protein BWY32_03398 [bacterium ADurb.Bin243]|nr:MAG: hypothetical protein BWY32_03398 [bacterium ADurb.Bin243]